MRSLLEVSGPLQVRAQLGDLRVGRADLLLQLADLRPVVARGQHVDLRGHEGMLASAELRAVAVVERRPPRLEPRERGVPGDRVDLAAQRRHPPGVDYV